MCIPRLWFMHSSIESASFWQKKASRRRYGAICETYKMACSYGRTVLLTCRRAISTNAAKRKEFLDPMEHVTGLEKRELLAIAAGDDDPFNLKPIKRGPSTKDCPTLVPSAFESRLIGCVCEEDQLHINWMWLHQGAPRRCGCGYWFKLVYKAPV